MADILTMTDDELESKEAQEKEELGETGLIATISDAIAKDMLELTPNSLQLIPGLSMDEWSAIGKRINSLQQGVQWWWGDWANYGDKAYGDKYLQAVEDTGYSYGTLANFCYVSGAVDPKHRRPELSFSHHEAVASLSPEQQVKALSIAVEQKLSRDAFRALVKGLKGQADKTQTQTARQETPTTAPGVPETVVAPTRAAIAEHARESLDWNERQLLIRDLADTLREEGIGVDVDFNVEPDEPAVEEIAPPPILSNMLEFILTQAGETFGERVPAPYIKEAGKLMRKLRALEAEDEAAQVAIKEAGRTLVLAPDDATIPPPTNVGWDLGDKSDE